MYYRAYGSTEIELSVIGFGGICVMDESAEDSARIVARAIDLGINYFDVAPQYGNAQEMLGPALEPYRNDVFLACKTLMRERDDALAEFERSLELLRTDRIDLYQLHAIETEEDADRVLAPGGALELFSELRDRGRISYIGFSAHNEDQAIRLLEAYPFDSVLFPINWIMWSTGRIGPRLIQTAQSRGTAVLALKSLAIRRWGDGETKTWPKAWYKPAESPEEVARGVRFTLSRPVTAAVSPGHEELLWAACDAADRFEPLTEDEERAIAEEARTVEPMFSRTVTAI
jgi:predicted aldo/keto reductase-like oxidoreductase